MRILFVVAIPVNIATASRVYTVADNVHTDSRLGGHFPLTLRRQFLNGGLGRLLDHNESDIVFKRLRVAEERDGLQYLIQDRRRFLVLMPDYSFFKPSQAEFFIAAATFDGAIAVEQQNSSRLEIGGSTPELSIRDGPQDHPGGLKTFDL